MRQGVWVPCDWDGQVVSSADEWPKRRGTNGEHPAYLALKQAWGGLVAQVRDIHKRQGGAMIDIAGCLLREHHPETFGWAERLAWEAAG